MVSLMVGSRDEGYQGRIWQWHTQGAGHVPSYHGHSGSGHQPPMLAKGATRSLMVELQGRGPSTRRV